MPWAIVLVGTPDGGHSVRIHQPWCGHYLAAYDPDAMAGLGEAVFTPEASDALRFDSIDAAKACWFQQSTVLPTRAVAGRPIENRPLAVCDISIDEI